MWILPSELCHCSPGSAASTSESRQPLSSLAPEAAWWLTASGKPTLQASSWRGWRTRPWSRRLFGAATYDSWMAALCAAGLTGLSGDSPARTSAAPAAAKASKRRKKKAAATSPKTAADSGLNMHALLARFDPQARTLKTSQLYAFQVADSISSSVNWPRSGMMRNGCIFALPTSAPPTSANESSSLHGIPPSGTDSGEARPTPVASEDNTSPEARTPNPGHQWPSPRAEDGESAGNHPRSVDSLTGATQLWNTPTSAPEAPNTNSNMTSKPGSMGEQATDWPTPRTANVSGSQQRLAQGPNPGLEDAAQDWQTPGADSFRSRGGDRKDEMGLDQQARAMNWPTPQVGTGEKSHNQMSGDFRGRMEELTQDLP